MRVKTWRAIAVLSLFCFISVIVSLIAAVPAQAQTAILTPEDGSGDIIYHGTGTPGVPVYLTISTTVSSSTFSDSDAPFEKKIELYSVQVQSPYDFSIEVSPVTSLDVSGRWVFPIWVRLGGTVDINNVGSYSRSGTMANTYDIKIEATPADTDLSITITSMYVPDANGDYTAVLNTAGIPDGVYLIKQGTEEIAKAYVGVEPPVTYQLNFSYGWNLVSIPITPESDSITSVIPPEAMEKIQIIWHYDNSNPAAPAWKFYKPGRAVNTLSSLTNGMGFWVLAKQDFSFTITGAIPDHSHATFNKGWNMVGPDGLSTLTPSGQYGAYYLTWGYKNGQWSYYKPSRTVNTLSVIEPGQGYWVLVK